MAASAQPWTSRAGAGSLAMGEASGSAWPGLEGRASNPAQGGDQPALLLSHTFWAQDVSADHAGLAWSLGLWALGLQASLEQAQGLDQRDAAGRWLGTATVQQQAYGVDASRRWGAWSAGAKGAVEMDPAPGASAHWGGGLGLAWSSRGASAGVAADSLGDTLLWRAGLLWPLGLGGSSVALGYLGDGPDARWGGGLQWRPWPALALRGGWQQAQTPQPGRTGQASLGLELALQSGQVAYAWLDDGELGQVHRLQWSGRLDWAADRPVAAFPAPVTPPPSPTAGATPSPLPSASPTPSPSPAPTASPTPVPIAVATPSPVPPKKPVNLRFVIP